MTPGEAGGALVRRLTAELRADRRALADRDAELDGFLVAWSGPPEGQAAALALVLERSYTALEASLERLVRGLDGTLDAGPDWHRELLRAASLDVPGVRPAVLASAAAAADELRRFRHFVRHAYTAKLKPDRVLDLAEGWQAARSHLAADLDRFEAFLDGLASRLDE